MTEKYLIPAVDIYETEDKYIILADMPGATKDSIEVSTEDEILVFSAKVSEVDKEWKPLDTEFKLYDYKREIRIGNKIDSDKIEAKYENGVLTLELGKSEQIKPRKIAVNIA